MTPDVVEKWEIGRGMELRDDAIAAVSTLDRATLTIAPAQALRVLGACVAFLVALHLLGTFSDEVLGRDSVFGLVPRFNLNNELTVPAWFTSSVLLAGGLLAVAIATTLRAKGGAGAKRWLLLATVLAFLSFDETMMVHEAFSVYARDAQTAAPSRLAVATGLLGAFAAVVTASGASLLRSLPSRIRWLSIAAVAVYVGGAVGMDELSSALYGREGASVGWHLLMLLE